MYTLIHTYMYTSTVISSAVCQMS